VSRASLSAPSSLRFVRLSEEDFTEGLARVSLSLDRDAA
jgi:hypothetical protein